MTMKRLLLSLIAFNAVLVAGLSVLVLANIWFPHIFDSARDLVWRLLVSYGVLAMNFIVLTFMLKRLEEDKK
jgi:hypothetical protein